uniref:Reelin n=1 Tax=Ciona savignyi TaxID=51511 RepID=H2Y855_CIOSA
GNLGFETALHFNGNCSRKLVTVAMDTSEADFVQFTFLLSCARGSDLYETDRTHGVMIDYSRNGGITWNALSELYYDGANARFVNILLPMEARAVGTQFRFVQPEFGDGLEEQWAVDNLFIGGKQEETVTILYDNFSHFAFPSYPNMHPNMVCVVFRSGTILVLDMWQFYDNTFPSNFCGRNNVIKAGEFSGLPVSVGTKDFVAETGYILQYTIVVLCERTKKPHQPVHVQYSTDFGDSWHYVTPQCTPDDKDCFGKEISQPTVHFASPNWRRKTICVLMFVFRRPIRFRLYQYASDVVWALDRLYIGLACPEACSGHGDCVKDAGREPYCICDAGFTGPNCYLQQQHQTYLKDTFASASVTSRQWGILDNAESSGNCGHLIESNALTFDGVGPKQAETIDLDLRDARFVQYHAIIGSYGMKTCLPVQHRHDGVIL